MGKTSVLSCQRLNDDIKSFAYIIWVEFDLDTALSAIIWVEFDLDTALSAIHEYSSLAQDSRVKRDGHTLLLLEGTDPPTW